MTHRAAAQLFGLVAAAWIVSRDLAFLPLPSAYLGYQPSDPLLAQLIEPVLHAPWTGSVSWAFAALLAFCLVSEAWLLSITYGASPVATAVTLIVMVVSEPWTGTVRHGGSLALAVAFSWLMWLFVVRDHAPTRGRNLSRAHFRGKALTPPGWLCVGLVSWMAAIASSWLALIGMPMLLAGLTTGEHRKRVRTAFVIAGMLASAAGLALYCARIGQVAAAMTAGDSPPPSWLDVLGVLLDPTHRTLLGSATLPNAESLIVIILAALGVTRATTRRRWRGSVFASVAVAVTIVILWPLWSKPITQLVVWLVTPFVAVGLTLVMRTVTARREALATGVAGVALVTFGIGNWFIWQTSPDLGGGAAVSRWLHQVLAGSQALSAGRDIKDAVLVAEDLEVDAAVIAAQGVAVQPWRVAQEPASIAELRNRGLTVLAGPVARRNLELSGFQFHDMIGRRPADAFGLSAISGQLHCAVVRSDRWSLLPGLEYTGRLGIEVPGGFGGVMTLVIGDADDRPRLIVSNVRGDEQPLKIEPLLTAPSVDAPPPDYWFDGGDPARAPSHVFRVQLPAHPTAPALLDVALGRRAPRVLARLNGFDSGAIGRVCAAPLSARQLWADDGEARESIVPLNAAAMLTSGWHEVEGEATGEAHRWTDRVAVVLIPSARRAPLRIAVDAEPAAIEGDRPMLGLIVNGVEQPTHAMRETRSRYEWNVPVSTWLTGTNELMFTVSRVLRPTDVGGQDPRVLGMKVSRLALTRLE